MADALSIKGANVVVALRPMNPAVGGCARCVRCGGPPFFSAYNVSDMNDEFLQMANTNSADETKALGSALAACVQAGDVVLLSGDLGAGKTQFTQGIAAGLGAGEAVISPTFNIVLTYGSGRLPLHHFDLYRLDSAEQLEDIGLREYLESGSVCVVEWAEKFPKAFDEHLAVDIVKTSDEGRLLRAHAVGPRFEELLAAWAEKVAAAKDALSVGGGEDALRPDAAVPSNDAVGDADRADARKTVRPSAVAVGSNARYVLAFDTSNEVVALGVGELVAESRQIKEVATREVRAHRASNTTLMPAIDGLLSELGITRAQIACVCVGRGPGSFTGVRIAMASAKGIAQALGVGLVGTSTLDAIAWNAQVAGVRGNLLVVADAMRKEVYPVRFSLFDDGVRRLTPDAVVKAAAFAGRLADEGERAGECADGSASDLLVVGDALMKYRDLLEPYTQVLDESLWEATGRGLLHALQAAWQSDVADPLDAVRHDPAFALPVYTRLSDAEENERVKLANNDEKNLRTGVQDVAPDGGTGRATMHAGARLVARADAQGVSYRPLDEASLDDVAALEAGSMGTDAWSASLFAGELGMRERTWWIAEVDGQLVGYAGGLVAGDDLQILKVATDPAHRRQGIARTLLAHIAEDARNLAASTCSLEVRASNSGAQAFYESLGLEPVGKRPRYYSDGEDAVIMQGPLPTAPHDVAGMELQRHDNTVVRDVASEHPLILAIESSCDETAAAVVDGQGNLLSDVVASQIDFHARFGGVVPEIASRKHIEAICGVCSEALAIDGLPANSERAAWQALDAIAVTYAPGLLGALVVGVAYAKGAAWALDIPLICVNHLEGHLYANRIGHPGFQPPAVVSLVSGGNTMLVHMRDWGRYETLGATIDDAVGEAFDKVSKALGLGYPGGPAVSREAAKGDPDAISFPRALLHSHDLRFSLSGLKTAVVNYIDNAQAAGQPLNIPDICAGFQQAVVDVQIAKANRALQQTGAPTFCLGGGVAANPVLRAAYEDLCKKLKVQLVMPPLSSCGDNAGMIALVALDRFRAGKFAFLNSDAQAHADLDEPY